MDRYVQIHVTGVALGHNLPEICRYPCRIVHRAIECCFVDDRDDVQLYDCQKMAEAIVFGITGQRP